MVSEKTFAEMLTLEKSDYLKSEQARIREMGGAEAVKLQHDMGKYTARERVEKLFDPGSFFEIGEFCRSVTPHYDIFKEAPPADGVITGYGTIGGKIVYGAFQDATVMGGTLGKIHADKIVRVLKEAANVGCPMLYVVDSEGLRIKEGPDSLSGLGDIVYNMTLFSGSIPQICAVMGSCPGGITTIPGLADCVFTVDKITKMYANDPSTITKVTGEEVGDEDIGGAAVHCGKSGVGTFLTKSEDDCIEQIKRLLTFLPSSVKEKPPYVETGDPADRTSEALATIVPDKATRPFNMKKLIGELVDNGDFMEWQEKYARNMICALARMDGNTVGILAQNPMVMAGCLDVNCSDKGSRFIRFCDAYNIPILNLVDVPGYLPGTDQEWMGIIRHGAKMLFAYAEATVPEITVVTRKAYGGSYLGMCSKDMGADIVMVWPGCEMAVMGPAGAVGIIERKAIKAAEDPVAKKDELTKEYVNRFLVPTAPAANLNLDTVIDPVETRPLVCRALKLFKNKEVKLPYKKHEIMPD